MVEGLIIGDVKEAELDLIPHVCDNTPGRVDYLDCPIFDVQLESTGPEEQRIVRDTGTVTNSDPQAFSIEDQLSNVALRPPACRQRPILPGEVDLGVRQDLDLVDPEHFARTFPVLALIVSAPASYLVPDPGDGPARTIADMYNAAFNMRRKPGRPDYRGTAFQPQALSVQDQLPDSFRIEELPVNRGYRLLSEKQYIRVRQPQFGGLVLRLEYSRYLAVATSKGHCRQQADNNEQKVGQPGTGLKPGGPVVAEVLSDAKSLMAASLPYDLWPYRGLRCANLLRDSVYLMTARLLMATQPKPAFRLGF